MRRLVLAAGLAGLTLVATAPARADHTAEPHLEAAPPAPTPPPAPSGLLRDAFPEAADRARALPPFLRDTGARARLRTFYFNREKSDGSASEAWALGGWLQYESGWWLDTFAIGAVGYTSQPLYAPDDRDGTLVLAPGQRGISVVGEAWAALRYEEYALLRGYRQRVDDGYLNPQDNRMIPNTFEGVVMSGKLAWLQYRAGYLWDIKPRDSNDFVSMSSQAGAPGGATGLLLTSLTLTPVTDLTVHLANYRVADVFNTAFAKAKYTRVLAADLSLDVGAQYTDQRSTGDARLGSFRTWNAGVGARLTWKRLSLGAAFHVTDDDESIRSPYGSWPGYLSLMVTDFDRAGEKAWGVGLKYDFAGSLLPMSAKGLTVHLLYAQGTDRRDPATQRGLPTTREGNLDVIYDVPAVKGLSLRFRNAYVDEGGPRVVMDFRLIVDYKLDLW